MHNPSNKYVSNRDNLVIVWIVLAIFLTNCSHPLDKEKLTGLWELDLVKTDGFTEPHVKSIYLQLKPNSTFSAAMRAGDIGGLYFISGQKQITMSSERDPAFSGDWQVDYLGDNQLILRGKAIYGAFFHSKLYGVGRKDDVRNTVLQFKSCEKMDDFASFEKKVLGDWEIFKVIRGNQEQKPENLALHLGNDGSYAFLQENKIIESGEAIINSRYKRIYTNSDMAWDVSFKGDGMILVNEMDDLQYRLRRKL